MSAPSASSAPIDLAAAPLDRPLGPDDPRTNLIVNYLPQSFSDEDFYSLFGQIGPIANAKIARDVSTGYSFGYGFINYECPQDAAQALTQYNGLAVQNKRIKVSYSRPKGEQIKDTNLYVANLGRNITEEVVRNAFNPFGQILTCKVITDANTGVPRGTAFVRFYKKEQAEDAIKALDGTQIEGVPNNTIQVRIAEEHGKQKAAYFANAAQQSNQAYYQPQPTPQHYGGGPQRRGRGGFAPPPGGFGGGYGGGRGGGGAAAYYSNSGGGYNTAGGGGDRFNPLQRGGGGRGGRGGGYNPRGGYGGPRGGYASGGRGGGGGAGFYSETQEYGAGSWQ